MVLTQINPSTVALVDDYLGSVVIVALSTVVIVLFRQVLVLYNTTIKNQSAQYENRLKREQELQEANTAAINKIVDAVEKLNENIQTKHKILEIKLDNLNKK